MSYDWHWWAAAIGGLVAIVFAWGMGYRAGSHGVGPGETKTVVTEHVVRDTAEEDRLRKQLDEVTAKKAHVVTVEKIVEVPGGERVITRTIRDESTQDTTAKAVEVREVVKVERVYVDRLVTVERKVVQDWSVGGGALLSPRADVVGAYGSVSRRILGRVGAVVTVSRTRGEWTAGIGAEVRW